MSVGVVWLIFQVMQQVECFVSEGGWKVFEFSWWIVWKIGISFGFWDVWAIGVMFWFVVGVWVGNVDGEGCFGLVGVKVVVLVLFDFFKLLFVLGDWFFMFYDDFKLIVICWESGYQAGLVCLKDII